MFAWLTSKFRRNPPRGGVGPLPGDVWVGDAAALGSATERGLQPVAAADPIVWAPTEPLTDELLPHGGGARDESERRSLALLQARGLSALQYVAETAARICETPMAAVSMADGDTVWFQAVVGASQTQVPRAQSFCTHALLRMPAMLVVPDTWEDARFDQLALVTESPHIRFYAGAPFATADGVSMGAVSVADTSPRVLTPVQLRTLELLARQTVMLLEARMRSEVASAD